MRAAIRTLLHAEESLKDAFQARHHSAVAMRRHIDEAAQQLQSASDWVDFDETNPNGWLHRRVQRGLRVIAALREKLPEMTDIERLARGSAPMGQVVEAPIVPIRNGCRWCQCFGECCQDHGRIGKAIAARRAAYLAKRGAQ